MIRKNKAFSDKFLHATFKVMANELTKNLKDINTQELMGVYLPLFTNTATNGSTKETKMEALELVKNIIKEAKDRGDVKIQAIQLDAKTGERMEMPFGQDPMDNLIEQLEKSINSHKDTKAQLDGLTVAQILGAPLPEDLKK